jgi:hypothetical protein
MSMPKPDEGEKESASDHPRVEPTRRRSILPRDETPEWCQTTTWMNGALVWRFLKERLQPKNKPTSE